jgi:hypothetical protein
MEMDSAFPLGHAYFAELVVLMGRYEQSIGEIKRLNG